MNMSDIISQKGIFAEQKATSKKRLLQEISEKAAAQFGFDTAIVHNALQEREALGSTGMGYGVAIPHARIENLNSVCGLFFKLEKPIDFDAVDRKPVDLVFVLFAPKSAGADHLKALARVSRTLREKSICEKLRSNQDPAIIYTILTEPSVNKAA